MLSQLSYIPKFLSLAKNLEHGDHCEHRERPSKSPCGLHVLYDLYVPLIDFQSILVFLVLFCPALQLGVRPTLLE